MLTGNAYGGVELLANTVATTQDQIACKRECENIIEIDDPAFFALVIDALDRLAIRNAIASARIGNLDPDEVAEGNEFARCAVDSRTITSFTERGAKALILAQINELLAG